MLSSRPSVALRAQPELDLWVSWGWGACFWSTWMCNIKYTWKEPGALHEQGGGWGGVREEGGMTRGGVTSVSFQVGFYGTTSNNRWLSLFLSLSPPWSLYRANWTVIGLSSLHGPVSPDIHPPSLFSEVTYNKCVNSPGARKTELLYSSREVRCGKVSQLTSVKHVHIKNTPTRAGWWLENWFNMINRWVHTSLQLKYRGTRICQSFNTWYVMGSKKTTLKKIYFCCFIKNK